MAPREISIFVQDSRDLYIMNLEGGSEGWETVPGITLIVNIIGEIKLILYESAVHPMIDKLGLRFAENKEVDSSVPSLLKLHTCYNKILKLEL